MSARIIINQEKPKTQTIDAVRALLAWRGRAAEPLPSFIEMGAGNNRLVLVLSNKKDCYYVATARDCSCPARNWHPNGPCKHMRRYFAEQQATKRPDDTAPNAGRWHGHNGPVLDEARPAKASSSIPLYIDMRDTTPAEAVYFERKEAIEFLPAEA